MQFAQKENENNALIFIKSCKPRIHVYKYINVMENHKLPISVRKMFQNEAIYKVIQFMLINEQRSSTDDFNITLESYFFVHLNPCPAEPGYILLLQTV